MFGFLNKFFGSTARTTDEEDDMLVLQTLNVLTMPATQEEVARALGRDTWTVEKVLRSLARRGLASCIGQRYQLTDEGWRLMVKYREVRLHQVLPDSSLAW